MPKIIENGVEREKTFDEINQDRLYDVMKELERRADKIIAKEADAYYIFDSWTEHPDDWKYQFTWEGVTYYADPDDRYSYEGAKKVIEIQKALGVSFLIPVDEEDCDCGRHELTCKTGETPCDCKTPCTCEAEEMDLIFKETCGEAGTSQLCPITGVPLNTDLLDEAIEYELRHFIEEGKMTVNRDVEQSDDLYWIYRLAHDAYYSKDTWEKYGEKILALAEFAVTNYNFADWLGDE